MLALLLGGSPEIQAVAFQGTDTSLCYYKD